jgi:hypothetical protein
MVLRPTAGKAQRFILSISRLAPLNAIPFLSTRSQLMLPLLKSLLPGPRDFSKGNISWLRVERKGIAFSGASLEMDRIDSSVNLRMKIVFLWEGMIAERGPDLLKSSDNKLGLVSN